ncbi:hypothetical protein VTK73DRAFT_6902 [Phialemonium thermophilum]|uniref:Yippee domain-containing protein n=1 Tax=Phialemonium thermophilum TaxID=223376 RepID=A0ABR3WHI7_9PEZI
MSEALLGSAFFRFVDLPTVREFKMPALPAPYFPTFLLPSVGIPFVRRRGRSSSYDDGQPGDADAVPSLSSSPSSSDPASPSSVSGAPSSFSARLPSSGSTRVAPTRPDTIRCASCATDIAYRSQIISKGFTGRHGRAYLVSPPAALSATAALTPPHLPIGPGSPFHGRRRSSRRSSGTADDRSNDGAGGGSDGDNLVNVQVGRPETRQLVTGSHVVADITCVVCGTSLGWKYLEAKEVSQHYKIGKYILETQKIVVCRGWDDVVGPHDNGADGRRGHDSDVVDDARRSSWFSDSGWVRRWSLSGRKGLTRKSWSSTSREGRASMDEVDEEDVHLDEDEPIVFDSEDEDECEDIFSGTWDPAVVAQRRRSKVASLAKRR